MTTTSSKLFTVLIISELFYFTISKFNRTQKYTAEQGTCRKAIFALNTQLQSHDFNAETQIAVFDTYINIILNYGSEIWGFHKCPDIEKHSFRYLQTFIRGT